MRISDQLAQEIKKLAESIFGTPIEVKLFGSRTQDHLKGGDLDLLIKTMEPVEEPAKKPALLAARVSRLCHGRKVDVLVIAPNLKYLPIHRIAEEQGVLL